MKRLFLFSCVAFTATTLSLSGCTNEPAATDSAAPVSELPPDTMEIAHAHPTEGPHDGALIELGAEEYHGELVHDEEGGTVTIYILDSTAKKTVAIDGPHVTINIRHDGQGKQFRLVASSDSDDPAGKSSRFVSDEKELGDDLHLDDVDAALVVEIAGKSYRGKIVHDHDHAGHDHAH